MSTLRKLVVLVGSFILGVIVAYYAVSWFARLAFPCPPAIATCDAGAYLGLMLLVVLAPLTGVVFAVIASRLYAKRLRRPG